MYSMQEVCNQVNMSYETLKYYCNEGLIPYVKRNENNYRVFDDHNIAWIKSLTCLKQCGMGITEMKAYVQLCMLGEVSIPERKSILERKKAHLLDKLQEIEESIAYIDSKQQFYDDVTTGKIPYMSNLIPNR